MRKPMIIMFFASMLGGGLVVALLQRHSIFSLFAATGTKAVVFVLGADCPPGMQSASAAGFPEMQDNRFPLLVNDTGSNSSGDTQIDNVSGGNATISWGQMPSHSHEQYVTACVAGGPSIRADWSHDGNCAVFQQGINTGGAGGGGAYWPRYYKLKPCIWTVN